MFFSIITVTRDNLAGLQGTQESLQSQTCRDFEWIVIDGASLDGTVEFLKTAAEQWISEPDHGIYDAMNKGINRAASEYLLFLNAGDRLAAPDTLEKIAAALPQTRHPGASRDLVNSREENALPDFIYGDSREGQFYKPARGHTRIAQGMFTHHQAMLYRRAAIGGLRYDLYYKIAADYDFTARFLKSARGILYLQFPLCIFEPGGVSQQKASLGRREQFNIRKKLQLISVPLNIAFYIIQSLLWRLRKLNPGFYWSLKSR